MSRHDYYYNNIPITKSFLKSKYSVFRFISTEVNNDGPETFTKIQHPGRRAWMRCFIHTQLKQLGMNLHKTWILGFIPKYFEQIEQSTGIRAWDIISFTIIFTIIGILFFYSNKDIKKSRDLMIQVDKLLEEKRREMLLSEPSNIIEIINAREAHAEKIERIAKFGEISQGLLHDLIGPLSAVSLSVENLAKKQTSPEETGEITQRAIQASRRMRSFMESVHSAMTTKIPKLQEFSSNITNELNIVIDLLKYKAKTTNVQVDVICCNNATLHIHPVRLQQLLLNIISNAIEACGISTSKIQKIVSIEIKKKSGDLHISISDNGSGIKPEYLKDLLINSFTTKNYGTGIGLMTAKSIVENELFGSIEITNVPTGGTLCKIIAPL